ncbi:hypothetical protein KSP39_PZI010851 [Platanthera zijinensis]|uniref:HhH-GPD domain-containing protein n=1 Tax=Platanthera zijinensis TaxID=2320716 RepID=A0AAP0G5I8_9ASPA
MTESIWPLPPPPPMPDSTLASPPSSSSLSFSSAGAGDKTLYRPRKLRKLSPESTRPPPPPPLLLPRPLSAEGELEAAVRHLRVIDPHLAAVIDELEPLGLHQFQPPFLTLARSIIHQQLAPKAAVPTYERFLKLCETQSGFSPAAVLALSAEQLRQIGVSARKAGYLHDLARKFHTGVLSDAAIVSHDDRSLLSPSHDGGGDRDLVGAHVHDFLAASAGRASHRRRRSASRRADSVRSRGDAEAVTDGAALRAVETVPIGGIMVHVASLAGQGGGWPKRRRIYSGNASSIADDGYISGSFPSFTWILHSE